MTDPEEPKSWRAGLSIINGGFVLVVCVALGLLLGHFLDKKLGTAPWMKVGGIVLGSVAGFLIFFRATLKAGHE